jgi:hypothetical protein
LKKKHLSLDEVKAFMESGAQGLEGVIDASALEPDVKKARTDGSGDASGAGAAEATAGASAPPSSLSSSSAQAGVADAKAEKKKKKKEKAVAAGALSKNLDKRNTKMLSFGDDDDGW